MISPSWAGSGPVVSLAAAILALVSGCTLAVSSESSSESSYDTSRSSSDSSSAPSARSSPGSRERAYREDVRAYTEAYATSGGPLDAFQRRLADIARRHDITNWEGSAATYVAIGEGLGRAAVSLPEFEMWQQSLAGTDAEHRAAMRRGYDAQPR